MVKIAGIFVSTSEISSQFLYEIIFKKQYMSNIVRVHNLYDMRYHTITLLCCLCLTNVLHNKSTLQILTLELMYNSSYKVTDYYYQIIKKEYEQCSIEKFFFIFVFYYYL